MHAYSTQKLKFTKGSQYKQIAKFTEMPAMARDPYLQIFPDTSNTIQLARNQKLLVPNQSTKLMIEDHPNQMIEMRY